MATRVLSKLARRDIAKEIDKLFERARIRLLGRDYGPKEIVFGYRPPEQLATEHKPELSIPGLFDASAKSEGFKPNEKLKESINEVVDGYLTAYQEKAKVGVIAAVQHFLQDAEAKGKVVDTDVVLGGHLAEVMTTIVNDVKRLVNTESTRARNAGSIDPISKVAAAVGQDDATVIFIGPLDKNTCLVCKKIFLLPDGVTPKAWKMSQVRSGYFKRGDTTPCIGGCHPNCRHQCVGLLPGFGLKNGKIEFLEIGWDEFKAQNS